MSAAQEYADTRPFDVEQVHTNMGFAPSLHAHNELSRAAARLIEGALRADWDFRIGISRPPRGAGGGSTTSVMIVLAKDDKALVAEITFIPTAVCILSFDPRFDAEERRVRYVVGDTPSVHFHGETLELKKVDFTTARDAARDIKTVVYCCNPEIQATAEVRDSKDELKIGYPNRIIVTGCPFAVQAVPSNNPGAYVVERNPSKTTANTGDTQILELPVPIQPESRLLYHTNDLPLPWMKEFLYGLFAMNGREYFDTDNSIDAILSEEDVDVLAEKMMPLPYSERGHFERAINTLRRPHTYRMDRTERAAMLTGPATVELLSLALDTLTGVYTEMAAEVKKLTGEEVSFLQANSLQDSMPSVQAIYDRMEEQDNLDKTLSAWCQKQKNG